MDRQRQLGVAISMYEQDHDGRLPERLADLARYTDPKNFVCPQSERSFHRQVGYGLNAALAGKPLRDFPNPAKTLATADANQPLFHSVTEIDRTRHHYSPIDGFVAAYLDGHAEFHPTGKSARETGSALFPSSFPLPWREGGQGVRSCVASRR